MIVKIVKRLLDRLGKDDESEASKNVKDVGCQTLKRLEMTYQRIYHIQSRIICLEEIEDQVKELFLTSKFIAISQES